MREREDLVDAITSVVLDVRRSDDLEYVLFVGRIAKVLEDECQAWYVSYLKRRGLVVDD